MHQLSIGFIGFGEAASHIARGLHDKSVRIFAYDIAITPAMRERAAASGTTLVDSPAELAANSRILFSTVTADRAVEAALQNAEFLGPEHIYADLNSVSPATKCEISSIIGGIPARFVEVAVMAPVPPYGHRVPMLLGGPAARDLVKMLAPLEMRLEIISDKIGTASAVKMFRSIIVKGLEALLVECVLGASRYQAAERVFASLDESFPGIDWTKLANYMVGRAVVHGERRAREMEEVADTLRAIDIDPIMAEAIARRQDWCGRLNLRSDFSSDGPKTYREVLDLLESRRD